MSKRVKTLLPSRTSTTTEHSQSPRLVDIDDEDADEVFQALSSETARNILSMLREEPRVPPDLANELDTSIQNVHYHLSNLEEVGLIEPIDTWYSEKGVEMNVYAPADDPLIIGSVREDQRPTIRKAIERMFGAVAVLTVLSFIVQWWIVDRPRNIARSQAPSDAPYIPPESAAGPSVLPPGVLFFLGGLAVLALVGGWWYYAASTSRQ